ncbi:MAG: type IV toxin-antitoxin system AbiEi family antitoxin domain-containing protein [Idiomarina sp.]|nr:type IV toxin-antitoxin system AbiEi family antitoxin domain-containing protein [Idiomarina sp.]
MNSLVFSKLLNQAILELLSDVPQTISFEHADELMQNLRNLSPRKLDPLLKSCRNIKAKRLFFWFAGRHQHPWLKHLNSEEYNFGSGKRVVANEGRLDPAWQITVPRDM